MHKLAVRCKDVLYTEELTLLADKGYISATDIANCIVNDINANVCMDKESLNFCIETKEDIEKPTIQTNGRIVYLKGRNIYV